MIIISCELRWLDEKMYISLGFIKSTNNCAVASWLLDDIRACKYYNLC